MAKTNNRNFWIVVLVIVVAGVFVLGNFDKLTGRAAAYVVRAHSCDADDSCEIRNADIDGALFVGDGGGLYLGSGSVFEFNGDIAPGGRPCLPGRFLRKIGVDTWTCDKLKCERLSVEFQEKRGRIACAVTSDPIRMALTGGGTVCNPGKVINEGPTSEREFYGECDSYGSNNSNKLWAICCG